MAQPPTESSASILRFLLCVGFLSVGVPQVAWADRSDSVPRFRRVSDSVFCGAQPENEFHFAALAKQNVTTIVSVDATTPAVKLAAKHGLRYIHIPIGYDKIDEDAAGSLVRVAREVEGAVYVHCHHGKHRGPTAAALVAIAAGQIDRDEAIRVLTEAGTNKNYVGLWQSVRSFRLPPAGARLPKLVEIAEVDPFAASMARIGVAFEKLHRLQKANWRPTDDAKALLPHQNALLVQEGFRESRRAGTNPGEVAFAEQLLRSETDAEKLKQALRQDDFTTASRLVKTLQQSCNRCHEEYR